MFPHEEEKKIYEVGYGRGNSSEGSSVSADSFSSISSEPVKFLIQLNGELLADSDHPIRVSDMKLSSLLRPEKSGENLDPKNLITRKKLLLRKLSGDNFSELKFKNKIINVRKDSKNSKESLTGFTKHQGDEESLHFISRRRRMKVKMLRRYRTLERFDTLSHDFKLKINDDAQGSDAKNIDKGILI
jgi:hypothetical protein